MRSYKTCARMQRAGELDLRSAAAESAALFALHGQDGEDADPPSAAAPAQARRSTSATELLAALHFVPAAFRGSKWQGLVVLRITRSFAVGISVDGETATVSYRTPAHDAEPFLTMEADRSVLLSMLEGRETPCMLVVSGALWVDNWQHVLLFQEAFDFDPVSYQRWKEAQQHVHLRPRHSNRASSFAGGADVDEDVEAAIQAVIRERAQPENGTASAIPTAYGELVGSLLCCSARKGPVPRDEPQGQGQGELWE